VVVICGDDAGRGFRRTATDTFALTCVQGFFDVCRDFLANASIYAKLEIGCELYRRIDRLNGNNSASIMFTLRCTKTLLYKMGATPILDMRKPTTVLGDWYANVIPTCRGEIVICTNERTLLTVILPLIDGQHPLSMFTLRVYNLLRLIGVSERRAEAEMTEMESVEIGKTQSRRVLGSMNEIALTLQIMAEDAPSGALKASEGELQIARSLFSYTEYMYPEELVRELLR